MKSMDMDILHDSSLVISEMALGSQLLSCLQIRIGKQNVEIIDVKVEIEKSKNELFQIS